MPYCDVPPSNTHFEAIQKIGATGILRGAGIPYKWANQTWFYPDSTITTEEFLEGYKTYGQTDFKSKDGKLTIGQAVSILETGLKVNGVSKNKTPIKKDFSAAGLQDKWREWQLENFDQNRSITRMELAVLLDKMINPFMLKPINHQGYFTHEQLNN